MTIDDQLTALAPEPEHEHVTSLQAAILTNALSGTPAPARRRPRTRTLVVVGAVAATAAAAVLVPALKSSPNAAPASALERLAATAAARHQTPMGNHWLHLSYRSVQAYRIVQARDPIEHVDDLTVTEDSWTRADGTWYARSHETETWLVGEGAATRTKTRRSVEYETTGRKGWLSPTRVAELPTDQRRLRAAMVAHMDSDVGSSRADQDDDLFGVAFAVLGGYPPPAVRAAIIRLVGSLEGVTVRATGNRTVITDTSTPTDTNANYASQTVVFDSRSAAWLSFTNVSAVGDIRSTTTLTGSNVVDRVPADVLKHAASHR